MNTDVKGLLRALARWLSWLEHHPIHQKVAGSIPSWGGNQSKLSHTVVSLSHSPFLSLSKK